MTEKMRLSIDVDVTDLNMGPDEVLENFPDFAAMALSDAQRKNDEFLAGAPEGVTAHPPYQVDVDNLEVYESIPHSACASCGKGEDEIDTFVVTTLDYTDIKNTRTEVCVPCWIEENLDLGRRTWVVIGADDYGVTVEVSGDNPEALVNRVASWAQQEEDRWPEHGLVYMLIEPTDTSLLDGP